MATVDTPNTARHAWPPAAAVLLGTLVAGTLDIGYAIVVSGLRGVSALTVLQSVASGLLGKESYDGGTTSALLGGVLHYAMMAAFVLAFFVLSRLWPALLRQPFGWGALYGVGVFCVMNFVVVPLSAIGHVIHRAALSSLLGELFSHVVFVGMTIGWITSRARTSAGAHPGTPGLVPPR